MWVQQSKKTCVQKWFYWNPSTCTCENGEYWENVIDDSVVKCDEIIDAFQLEKSNVKKATYTMNNFYIFSHFY